MHDAGDLPSHPWRDGVADLPVLPALRSLEEVIVGEGLQSGGFPHREATHLTRIGMNEIVPVLLQVAGNSQTRLALQLHLEAIYKLATFPVLVLRVQSLRKLFRAARRAPVHLAEGRNEGIPLQVLGLVTASFVVE